MKYSIIVTLALLTGALAAPLANTNAAHVTLEERGDIIEERGNGYSKAVKGVGERGNGYSKPVKKIEERGNGYSKPVKKIEERGKGSSYSKAAKDSPPL